MEDQESKKDSFGALLGEFLDKAIMALDDLSVATEQFIDKCVDGNFVKPHSADIERLKRLESLQTDFQETKEKEPKSHSKSRSKREKKIDNDEQPKPIEKTENIEESTELQNVAESVEGSQENSQRRRKRRHHHQEQEQQHD